MEEANRPTNRLLTTLHERHSKRRSSASACAKRSATPAHLLHSRDVEGGLDAPAERLGVCE
jgi:hypothetical protein